LEERAGERRPSRREIAAALVCHSVCALSPTLSPRSVGGEREKRPVAENGVKP